MDFRYGGDWTGRQLGYRYIAVETINVHTQTNHSAKSTRSALMMSSCALVDYIRMDVRPFCHISASCSRQFSVGTVLVTHTAKVNHYKD